MPLFSRGLLGKRGSYSIANSIRLRTGQDIKKTWGSSGSLTIGGFSLWVKRGLLGTRQAIAYGGVSGTYAHCLEFTANNALEFYGLGSGAAMDLVSTPLLRDPSGWYHICVSWDTTQGTASNRVKIEVNGVQLTLTGTYPSASASLEFDRSGNTLYYGSRYSTDEYGDYYLSSVEHFNGTQYTASSFGGANADGVWVPKAFSGTYGTCGHKLLFADGTSTTTLGYDTSGNSNNFTLTGFSLTAGVTYDWMTDTPTNNYCTITPINSYASTTPQYGNLRLVGNAATGQGRPATIAVSSGKWYWEVTATTIASYDEVGIFSAARQWVSQDYPGRYSDSYGYRADGKKESGSVTAYGTAWSNGDVIGVAFDATTGTLEFFKNNTSQGTAFTGISGEFLPAMATYNSGNTLDANFGQRPFAYTPPTGFESLCTANLPAVAIPNPALYYDEIYYTGNGATRTFTGLGFQPDMVEIKCLSNGLDFVQVDSVRGATKELNMNTAVAESTVATGVTAFTADGFTIGTGGNYNTSGYTYIARCWKAGGNSNTFNKDGIGYASMAAAGLTDGTISATGISLNSTSKLSITAFTGTATAGSVCHALGVVPDLVIIKNLDTANSFQLNQTGFSGATGYMNPDVLSAETTDATCFASAATSNVVNIGNNTAINGSGNRCIMFCWASVKGYSSFDRHTGNLNADGPLVNLGFRPKNLILKALNYATTYIDISGERDTYNPTTHSVAWDTSLAEATTYTNDFCANGFKVRDASAANNKADSMLRIAFAEHPFGGSNVSPSPAR